MCDGTRGMYAVGGKEAIERYDVVFEFAGERYYVCIDGRGNLWKSMVDHDLEMHDRLCEIITIDNIVSVNDKDCQYVKYISGWNDILEMNEACWRFDDCSIEYKERNGLTWLEMHPIVDGVERFQIVDIDWSDCEEILMRLKECDSPIGAMEDVYGILIGSEDAIPCSEDHRPMEFVRETWDGTDVVDRRYWPTEEDAIADAELCWEKVVEEDRGRISVLAGIIEEDYPVSGGVAIIVADYPDDLEDGSEADHRSTMALHRPME